MNYHAAPSGRCWTYAHVLLICPPLANELNNSCRVLVNLARQLARQSVRVCRMDYHGTGDSPLDLYECRAEFFGRAVQDVAAVLRSDLPAARLTLLGVRAGGLFASWYAASSADVSALILVDAIERPASYVKELRCSAVVAGLADGYQRPRAAGGIDAFGFSFSEDLVEGLGRPVTGVPPGLPRFSLASATAAGCSRRRFWSRNDVYRLTQLEDQVLDCLQRIDATHAKASHDHL
ncbi:MAG: alpha/beta hydrolase [Isosphaeraceae bacterium]|nr:alpha/beta hydrolase [Isosphaeraceae bacterium]